MKTVFVRMHSSSEPITLSMDANGSQASSSIFLNGNWIKTVEGDFSDFFLGTNIGLRNNNILITTQVARFPVNIARSRVSFLIKGADEVFYIDAEGEKVDENPILSNERFQDHAPNVPHVITYYFI